MLGLEAKGWMQSLSVVEASPLHRPEYISRKCIPMYPERIPVGVMEYT